MSLLYRYEFKNTLRFMLVLLLCALIACTVIQFTVSQEQMDHRIDEFGKSNTRFFLIALSMLVFGGAAVSFFFYVSGLLSKDVFTDRGYLTMTLPYTGFQTLGAKTLLALTWLVILLVIGIAYNLLLVRVFFPAEMVNNFYETLFQREALQVLGKLWCTGLSNFLAQVQLVFFSIILAKMTVSRYRLSGLWFILFLILLGIYGRLQYHVLTFLGAATWFSPFELVFGVGTGPLDVVLNIEYWGQMILVNLLVAVVLWIVNSLLWEKKVEI